MILFIFKLLVIALVAFCTYHLIKTCLFWKKDRKIVGFFNKTPSFSPLLTNSYVRFSGHSNKKNPVYRSYHVTAEWKDKLKKPDKGYQVIKKPIYQEISEQVLIMASGDDDVFVAPGHFERDGINLIHSKTSHTKQCPTAALANDTPRYTKYYETNKKLEGGEAVTIYGKLIKRDGVLHLVPTQDEGFPSALAIGSESAIHEFFLEKINRKYKSDLASLLFALIALILIYALILS